MTFRAVSLILALPLLATREAQEPVALALPMDEVPVQQRLVSGNGRYSFKSGCVIVLEKDRAVARREGDVCELHNQAIALPYASGD